MLVPNILYGDTRNIIHIYRDPNYHGYNFTDIQNITHSVSNIISKTVSLVLRPIGPGYYVELPIELK